MNAAPVCKHLRHKSMFIPALAKAASDENNSTGHSHHCWCNQTLTETGPDDRPASQQLCRLARSCFEE